MRSDAQLDRAEAAANAAAAPHIILDEKMRTRDDHISITTTHLAKGLEYRAVAVIACDNEVLPLQDRIESVSDRSGPGGRLPDGATSAVRCLHASAGEVARDGGRGGERVSGGHGVGVADSGFCA